LNGTKTDQKLSNKYDLSFASKEATDETWLISIRMSFYSLRAMTEKAVSSYVVVHGFGVKSRGWSEERWMDVARQQRSRRHKWHQVE